VTATTRDLKNDIDEIMPGVIADRRFLHEHPELGFQEFETARLVAERLESMGVEDIRTGIAVTGVTGLIKGTKTGGPEKVVLVRADMDALPILEENEVDYRSKIDGKMHACGHDAHTSMLLGVGRLLLDRRDEFSGTVKLLFQPAEEGGGGARVMIGKACSRIRPSISSLGSTSRPRCRWGRSSCAVDPAWPPPIDSRS
jgi:amidohydrolase